MHLHHTYHTTCRIRCACTVRTTTHHVSEQVRLHRTYHNTSRVGTGAPAPYVPHHVTCRSRCTCIAQLKTTHLGRSFCRAKCAVHVCACIVSVCVCAPARERACLCNVTIRIDWFWCVRPPQTRVKQNFASLIITCSREANFCVIHDVRHHHHQVHVQYLAIVTGAENPEEVEEILRKRVSRILVQERPQGRRRSNVMEARKTATHVRHGVRRGHFDLISTAPAGRQAEVCESFPRNAFSLGFSPDAKHGRFLPELWCYLEENERRERGGQKGGGRGQTKRRWRSNWFE